MRLRNPSTRKRKTTSLDAHEKDHKGALWAKVQAFWVDYGMWLFLVWLISLAVAALFATSGKELRSGDDQTAKALSIVLPVIVGTLPAGVFTWWLVRERRKR